MVASTETRFIASLVFYIVICTFLSLNHKILFKVKYFVVICVLSMLDLHF